LRVLASGQQNELKTAAVVKKFVEERSATLPSGVEMDIWIDRSHYLSGRLQMMMKNMWQGVLLVFIVLSLFLRMKVASWVVVGIPIAFLGTLALMPVGPWPVTINMLSLFGFIIVLGIVVDDAIIIGESIYTKTRADGHTLDNVISGAHRVAIPATFGVLTTMAAFAPMLFVGGIVAPFFEAISVVVILCLFFSLVESKLILPAHLANARIKPIDEDDLFHPTRLHALIDNHYRPLLERALDNRGMTVTIFLAGMILTFGLLGSSLVRVVLFPDVPSDFVQVQLQMETGTSPEARNAVLESMEQSIIDLNEEYVAEHPDSLPMIRHVGAFTQGDTGAIVFVEMPQDESRPFNGDEISKRWRERVGEHPGVKELTFTDADHLGGGPPLSFQLSGTDYVALERAAAELEARLAEFEGIYDIRNTSTSGGEEIRLKIKPEAEALGLNMTSLGRQVRQAFYGEEAQRIQRGKDELRVMVRYPIEERRSIADLENMRIRTPGMHKSSSQARLSGRSPRNTFPIFSLITRASNTGSKVRARNRPTWCAISRWLPSRRSALFMR
jgi:multidrug efflux pump subunit AcrB